MLYRWNTRITRSTGFQSCASNPPFCENTMQLTVTMRMYPKRNTPIRRHIETKRTTRFANVNCVPPTKNALKYVAISTTRPSATPATESPARTPQSATANPANKSLPVRRNITNSSTAGNVTSSSSVSGRNVCPIRHIGSENATSRVPIPARMLRTYRDQLTRRRSANCSSGIITLPKIRYMHAVQMPIATWPHHTNTASMEPAPTQPASPATIMRHRPGIGSSGGMSPSASESGCHTAGAAIG